MFSAAPFIGVLVAWLVLADPVRPAEAAAMLIAAFGVSRVLASQHEHAHQHRPLEHDHGDGHHDHPHTTGNKTARHTHLHRHEALVDAHRHVPDLHHRHDHGDD